MIKVTQRSVVLLCASIGSVGLVACSSDNATERSNTGDQVVTQADMAAITAVTATGEPNDYAFSVTVRSPDTGCTQYADWWEVLRADGTLIYRRVLAHSHVTEQPFTRSGGPVAIEASEEVIVRAHMNSVGYGELVFSGSLEGGFIQDTLSASFAENLENSDPLPDTCAF